MSFVRGIVDWLVAAMLVQSLAVVVEVGMKVPGFVRMAVWLGKIEQLVFVGALVQGKKVAQAALVVSDIAFAGRCLQTSASVDDGTPAARAIAGMMLGTLIAVGTEHTVERYHLAREIVAVANSDAVAEVACSIAFEVAGRIRVETDIRRDQVKSENARPHVLAAAPG